MGLIIFVIASGLTLVFGLVLFVSATILAVSAGLASYCEIVRRRSLPLRASTCTCRSSVSLARLGI